MTESTDDRDNRFAKIKLLAEGAGIISTVIALVALSVSLSDLADKAKAARNEADAEEIRQWQEVVVFSLLENAEADGKTFEQLNIDYKVAIPETTLPIPKNEITKEALKRILLRLIEKHAVVIDYRGSYKIAHEFAMHNPKFAAPIITAQPLVQTVLRFIRANEHKYDAAEVARNVSNQNNAKIEDVERVIIEGSALEMIKTDKDNKLYTNFATGQMPPP